MLASDALEDFSETFQDLPAKVFESSTEAMRFAVQLIQLDISYRIKLITYPKRLKLPMQIVVILLEGVEPNDTLH